MAKAKGASYCNCEICKNGNKEIGPKLCGPCILGIKSHFVTARTRRTYWSKKWVSKGGWNCFAEMEV